jgi:hypothetical protein
MRDEFLNEAPFFGLEDARNEIADGSPTVAGQRQCCIRLPILA